MKHIVFGEGKHDAHFMCMALNKCLPDPTVDWFLAEGLDGGTSLVPEEERALREFVYRRESGYLVKSEEGVSNLIRLFAYNCDDIALGKFQATLVVDLDENGMDTLVSKVRDKLEEYYRGQIALSEYSHESTASDLRTWTSTIEAPDRAVSSEVTIVTFDDDLEAAAGIDYYDGWHQRSIDINEYASRDDVQAALSEAFS